MTKEEAIEALEGTRIFDEMGLAEAAHMALEALKALKEKQAGGWISVKDRLPEEPEEALTAKEMAEVACALDLLKEYQSLGSIEHFREFSQAEKDGRLVVLPVPVGPGKVAYGLTDPDYGPERIVTIECDHLERLEIWDNPGREVVVEVDGWEIGESDIGKFVFLTREEAEAALVEKGGA